MVRVKSHPNSTENHMLQAGVTTIMHRSSRYKDKEDFFWIGVRENLNWNPPIFHGKKNMFKNYGVRWRFYKTNPLKATSTSTPHHHQVMMRGAKISIEIWWNVNRWSQNGNILPSGKQTVCYWKWPFIVDLPINSMVIFHSYVLC